MILPFRGSLPPDPQPPAPTITPAGAAVGVLGEVAPQGPLQRREQEWLANRDVAQESAFANVAAGLLLGGGVAQQNGQTVRLGRNLFTEAEHAAGRRAAREFLRRAGSSSEGSESAADIARGREDDSGVAYLRDNSDGILDSLATKQAKAAQSLIDSYDELAQLRQTPTEVAARIPDKARDQAFWLTRAHDDVAAVVDSLPKDLASPLRRRLATLGDGKDPARWFMAATELSDGLLRAAAKADRIAPERYSSTGTDGVRLPTMAEQIRRAKDDLDAGLADTGIWGEAATLEAQRSAGYAQRYGEHIGDFERIFMIAPGSRATRRTDPSKFRQLLSGTDDPEAADVLDRTIESARATADVAERFGRRSDTAKIRAALRTMEQTRRQGDALRSARGTVAREMPDSPSEAAIQWLSGGAPGLAGARAQAELLGAAQTGEPNATAEAAQQRLAARDGVFRATSRMVQVDRDGQRNGVSEMLSPSPAEGGEGTVALETERPALLTVDSFDAHRAHVEKMATDPRYFADVMGASFGMMSEAAPEVYAAISAQAAKTVQYLNAVAPGGEGGGPFGERIPVSADELWEYNERLGAIADPEHVPQDLALGRLSAPAIESYQVMYPKKYGELQQRVFERLSELKDRGVPVPIQAREQLDVLLGIDGGGDPALSWKVAERAYAAIARKNATRSLRGDNPGTDPGEQGMTSTALSTLNNGASAVAQTG